MKTHYSCLLIVLAVSNPFATRSDAHHEIAEDMNLGVPMQIVGEIVAVNWGEPHSTLQINIERDNQPPQEWIIQMDSVSDLIVMDIGTTEIRAGDWVAVVLFLSQSTACDDRCVAYGLSLTDEDQNSYTISQEVYGLFVEFRGREA